MVTTKAVPAERTSCVPPLAMVEELASPPENTFSMPLLMVAPL
jgi:hypothetical protein